MLRVSLIGNLGADPEVRFTQKGTQVASFRVAVNQVRTGPDGERQENTEWFRVRTASRLVDFVQRLTKGTRVMVIGRLDIGRYQARDGETRTSYDVWADEIQSMSARGLGGDAEAMQDLEADGPEPAVAGVSSLSGAAAGISSLSGAAAGISSLSGAAAARGGSGAKNGRAGARTEGARSSAEGEDLEDLPF
jgi:single-strand DNA-binding protein